MDARVDALIDELSSAESFDPMAVRERIWALFKEVDDERSRVALLYSFDALMKMVVRRLESEGQDTNDLRNAILADKRTFALSEAMLDGENVDPDALHYVVEREIAAGRIEQDDFRELAAAGSKVLGRNEQRERPKGLLRRIFG